AKGRRIKRYASKDALRQKMQQPAAWEHYVKRQGMVEPVFSHLRYQQGLNRFRRKGLAGVRQACLRPRERFWDIPVPKIDSAFDNLFVPQPSWSPSTTQQLRKLVAAPYLAPNDWTPRSEAYFVFPLAQGTPGKQCGLAATGVYQPSLRSPWLAAVEFSLHALAYNLSRAVALFSSSTGRYLVFFRILTRLRRIP
ncbi:transposase, partial [Thiolapillus sp.]